MSKEVDQRVVQMRFDNQQFESGVKTTLGTLDKLKNGLNLEKSANSLENLNSSVKKLDFNPLAAGVETVKNKFSALEVMAVTALANITNSVVNTGRQMLNSLTVAPIKQGFDEYELKMGSVQTIMASTGATLEEVNGYLNELNIYADKTIYSFSDMTSSIGKFTNSGVSLDKAVKAIQGISNEAAVSGANAQQASHAMYNFAQALSSGSVKLIDWKSIENANMATVEFKQQLIDTAVALGTLVKQGDKYVSTTTNAKGEVSDAFTATSLFNDSLNSQWMTTDVLVETLGKYADETTEIGKKAFAAAQDVKTFTQLMDTLGEAVGSGWAETWEILFGDFEEAKKLWTDVSNVVGGFIDKQSKARNDLLQGWKDMGGRVAAIEALKNAFNGLTSVVKPVTEAFREAFPTTTAKQLMDITEQFGKFTAKLKLSDEQAQNFKAAFRGLFSAIKIVVDIMKAVVSGVFSLAKNFKDSGDTILNAAAAVGEWFTNLRKSSEETNIFNNTVGAIVGVLQKAIDKIKEFFGVVKEKFDAIGFTTFLGVLKAIYGFAVKVGKVILDVGKKIGSAILDVFKAGGVSELINVLNGGLFGAFLININKLVNGVTGAFGGISDILDGVKGSLEAWQKSINAGTLLKIAKAVAILAASLFLIAMIDGEKLVNALEGLSVIFMELTLTMSKFSKMEMTLKGTGGLFTTMLGVSVSVLILAAALKKLSSLSWEELAKGLVGVFTLTALVVASCKALDGIKGHAIKGATNIVIFAAAIKILASACKDLSGLSWEELLKGLAGVGVLLAEVDIFLNTAKFSGKAFTACLGMIELAAAIKILASAAGDFAKMEWSGIAKGLGAIGGLLVELGLFVNLTGNAKHVFSTGLALIEIAAAMKIFASAIYDFAQMSWSEIGRGLTAMAGALAEVVTALKFMPKNVFGIGTGLIVVGTALNIISIALGKMGGMSWGEIAKGLAAMGGSMLILALGLNGMKKALGGAAALTVTAGALMLLVPELKILGSMSIQQIGIALVALAGSFLVLGVAAKVLKPLVGTMIKVAGAITLFGVGCALAGAGILAVSVGLTALCASLVVAVASLGEIISGVCYSIANSSKAIAAAFVGLIEAACIALKGTIPLVSETLVTVLVESLTSLKTYLPKIVDLVMDIATQLMDKLTLRIPELVTSAVNMVGRFMDALDDALGAKGMKQLITSLESVSIIFVAFAKTAEIISSLSVKDVLKGLPAFALAVAGFGVILVALGGISKIPGATEVIDNGAKIFASLGNAIGAFIGCLITGLITNLPKDVSQTVAAMGTVVAIVLALAPVVEALSEIEADIKNVLKGMASVGLVIAGITAVLAALGGLSKIPGFNELIGNGSNVLSGIGRALGLFVGSLIDGLSQALTSDYEQIAKALVVVCSSMLAIGVLTKIVKGINPKDAAMGIAAFAVVVAGLAAIFAALGGLAQIPGFNWIIGEGGEVLCKIGSILGEFIGSIVSGLGVGLTSGLPAMGQNLSDFMTSLIPFLEGAKSISPEMMSGVKALAETILIITAAEFLSGITSFLTGSNDLSKFAEEIVDFGRGLQRFAYVVEGISNYETDINAAAGVGKRLAEMAKVIPNEGGLLGLFAGENDLSKFAEGIVDFGRGLQNFAHTVKGISKDETDINSAAKSGKVLAEMARVIPNEGGLLGLFAGENDLSKFATGIVDFGRGLQGFVYQVRGISKDETDINAAANAGKRLAEMAKVIPNEGGLLGLFAGENDLSKFAEGIRDFGVGLNHFSYQVRGISKDETDINSAAKSGKVLAEMARVIPNEGGLLGLFAGENDLSKFAEGIRDFGVGLNHFSYQVRGISNSKADINCAAEAGKRLAEMANVIPNEGGLLGLFAGENDLSKFAEGIRDFGVGLNHFSYQVSGISKYEKDMYAAVKVGKIFAETVGSFPNDESSFKMEVPMTDLGSAILSLSSSLSGIKMSDISRKILQIISLAKDIKDADMSGFGNLADSLKNVSDDGITKFINSFKNSGTRAKDAIKDFVDKVIGHLKERKSDFVTIGSDYILAFIDAVKNKTQTVCDGLEAVINSGISAIRGKREGFYNAGKFLTDGFATGISNNLEGVEEAASGMGQAALNAARKTLDINSPSKKAYSLGDYTGMAFVTALDDYRGKSYAAGARMANSAKDGLADAISRVSDIIDGKVTCTPTIRPVMDLSDVESKASKIGNLFSAQYSTELAAQTSFGVSTPIERIQSVTTNNRDVVSAISALREDVASLKAVMANQQIVLDSGKLVGSIAPKMDSALGRRLEMAKRR